MKKITLLLLVSGIIFSMSCKKDTKITDIINPGASMKCNIGGASWSAVSRVTTKQGNKFIITGTGSMGSDVLNVTIFGATPGTYTIDPQAAQIQASATFTKSTALDSLYTAFEGTATLSSVDTTNKKISGTFSFKAKNLTHPLLSNMIITSGTFTNLIYQ